ncbi:MAG: hypothetical protein PHU61_03830 [Candidatus Absconditabacteria bacterium]|nr:hypothetical protein [Candidatus Absconditabacteria bacterium]MDD3868592.1 hypothetical protein [Candidatus Absconditabacteria bacterium]MDD4714739.1 hypothetical protein [Candidatus Absconditabacteria bacterium]
MQQLELLWADLLWELNKAREWLSGRSKTLTGWSDMGVLIFWIILTIYLIVFGIFLPLHRKILRSLKKAEQDLVQLVDKIIYLLSKAQYQSNISKRDLGGDPCMALMKEIFRSGNFNYLDNIPRIKEDVAKVELLLQTQVGTEEERAQIAKLQKKMKKLIRWKKFFGRIITIFTLGIYKPFW